MKSKETSGKIAVMQAHVEGKEIEAKCPNSEWYHEPNPTWNWFLVDYRIKPREPRRIWVGEKGKILSPYHFENRNEAISHSLQIYGDVEAIEFVEVIKP